VRNTCNIGAFTTCQLDRLIPYLGCSMKKSINTIAILAGLLVVVSFLIPTKSANAQCSFTITNQSTGGSCTPGNTCGGGLLCNDCITFDVTNTNTDPLCCIDVITVAGPVGQCFLACGFGGKSRGDCNTGNEMLTATNPSNWLCPGQTTTISLCRTPSMGTKTFSITVNCCGGNTATQTVTF
jgi:hypothetical protein